MIGKSCFLFDLWDKAVLRFDSAHNLSTLLVYEIRYESVAFGQRRLSASAKALKFREDLLVGFLVPIYALANNILLNHSKNSKLGSFNVVMVGFLSLISFALT